MLEEITNLEGYMARYGTLLGEQAQAAVHPLHVPGKHPPAGVISLREPFEAQAHVIAASTKGLGEHKSLTICGECGVGKTLCGMLTVDNHAGVKPYRALVFCPPHLVGKWKRELEETIPACQATIIDDYRQVTRHNWRQKPTLPEWWIVSNNRAKLGAKWRSSYTTRPTPPGVAFCTHCDHPVLKKDSETQQLVPMPLEELDKKRLFCEECGSALWTYTHDLDRWPVATYIHKHLKGVFRYLIVDECHEEKGEDTAQANAMGSLASACRYVIAMTGTLIGGYADHLRTLRFRLSPTSLVEEGFGWSDRMPFNERYGRIERKVTTKEDLGSGKTNRQSRGSSQRTVKYVRPGIVPTFFGRHLMGNTVFLGLEEVADNLPSLTEEVVPVAMDSEQRSEYRRIEELLTAALKQMVAKGDKRLLGAMLQTLLCYCDKPYGWGEIGYYENSDDSDARVWVPVVEPANLDADLLRPKEAELVRLISAEKRENRQTWLFTTMTDKRDVTERMQVLLEQAGISSTILRANVETKKREDWIAKHGPEHDCIISHPQLIQTGIDLFDKKGNYNFPTIVWYLTGYNLFTLRQASRRAWRIGQQQPCKVLYLYYEETMQARAMTLMGTKLTAAEAIEGKFSAEGLAAMAGTEGSMEMALARSLVNQLDDLDASRCWKKVGAKASPAPAMPQARPEPSLVRRPLRPKKQAPPKPVFQQMSLFDDLAVA